MLGLLVTGFHRRRIFGMRARLILTRTGLALAVTRLLTLAFTLTATFTRARPFCMVLTLSLASRAILLAITKEMLEIILEDRFLLERIIRTIDVIIRNIPMQRQSIRAADRGFKRAVFNNP